MYEVVEPGDRPTFVEGWHDLRPSLALTDVKGLAIQKLGYLLELSYQAVNKLGESYRGFRVGAAALAIDQAGMRSGIYFHGNYTPYKGADWNCAEKRLLEKVAERGFTSIAALAITGPLQPDETSGIESPTLHPCSRCRDLLGSSSLISPDTLVATMNLSENQYELFTVNSLLKLHQTKEPQPFPGEYHPLLSVYWERLLTFDRQEELAERAFMQKLYEHANR